MKNVVPEIEHLLRKIDRNAEKIFCLGLSRTGTSSLSEALKILGYKTIHFPSFKFLPFYGLYFYRYQLFEYDAFSDISVIPFYKKFDRMFSNSKFILTIRELDSWLYSCSNFLRFSDFSSNSTPKLKALRKHIYNSNSFNESKFRAAYRRHFNEVTSHFRSSNKLLIMNIIEGDGWKKLCSFLNKEIPVSNFPFLNKRQELFGS